MIKTSAGHYAKMPPVLVQLTRSAVSGKLQSNAL